MRLILRTLLPALLLAVLSSAAQSQTGPADSVSHQIRLRDGSTLLALLLADTPDSVQVRSAGSTFWIQRPRIEAITAVSGSVRADGQFWPEDPHASRLLFAPTGRMMRSGTGYYTNTMLIFHSFVTAPTDRFTIGGGFSSVPSNNFIGDNAYYVTPKVGLISGGGLDVAAGALIGYFPGDDGHSFGIPFVVATRGSLAGSITGGVGLGYADGRFAQDPVAMVGGTLRMSRRTAFISENYFLPASASRENALVSYGIRFFGDKLSADFALVNLPSDPIFPGVPFLSFAVRF